MNSLNPQRYTQKHWRLLKDCYKFNSRKSVSLMDTCFRPYELITKQRMSLVTAEAYRLQAPHGTNRWASSIHLTLILMISKSRSEKSQKASGAISCAFHRLQLPAIPFHVTWFLMIICFLFAISFGWKSKLRSIRENLETKFNVKKRSRKKNFAQNHSDQSCATVSTSFRFD